MLLTFFQNDYFFQDHYQSMPMCQLNSFKPDQDRNFVGPDLGPKCLQRLPRYQQTTKVATRKERFNLEMKHKAPKGQLVASSTAIKMS